jgi:transcriptional regulator of met regulon
MKDKNDIWDIKASAEDYSAAQKYLTLLFSEREAKRLVRRLRHAPTIEYEAKDFLRASQTHLLGKDNPNLADDLKKIKKRERNYRPCYSSEETENWA